MITKNNYNLAGILRGLAALSLLALLILRSYAAFFTQPVVAHDDKHYRAAAVFLGDNISTAQAFKEVLLPTSRHLRERTIGYISWLVLGQKLLGSFDMERRWQIVNLVLFYLQALFIYLLALWASKKEWFAASLTFLYLSMPIVFGMNRWIMNENFVFTALLAFPLCAIRLIDREKRAERTEGRRFIIEEACVPAGAAYVMGMFATLREYALPSLLAMAAVVILTLAFKKRWIALAVFTAVFAPFCIAATKAAVLVLTYTIQKTGMVKDFSHPDVALNKYYVPWSDWTYRVVVRCIGPAMTVFLCGGLAFLARRVYNSVSGYFEAERGILPVIKEWGSGVRLLFICLLALSALYGAAVLMSTNRMLRVAIPPVMSLVVLILMGIRIFDSAGVYLSSVKVKKYLIGLILLSWVTMLFQLFVSYGGGKDFVIRPYYMPTYNHPLHLRELKGPGDWHVVDDEE